MDKEKGREWMQSNDRFSKAYRDGVLGFLEYAFSKAGESQLIACPCNQCKNASHHDRKTVSNHLIIYGIDKGYTTWYFHGESLMDVDGNEEGNENELDVGDEDDDEIGEMLDDMFPNIGQTEEGEPNDYAKIFYKLLQDNEQPLYEGSKCSKLSGLVKLLHVKSLGSWSNYSFSKLLDVLKNDILPSGSCLPDSYYEAKKLIRDLRLSYKKIDACPNHCMLYWKEHENSESCKVCKRSRWKEDTRSGEPKVGKSGKKISAKTLRYFPLKPKLQRLFMSSKTASLMSWHRDRKVDPNVARHPADSKAWKDFDELHSAFAMEPRNVRLGLASDGFQAYNNSRTSYSIWPVVLIPYNLPPHMCMKQPNFILSMLIPGPDGPGDAIDTYLQPLVEELKELWEEGVETYDASTKKNFTMHAALLWTINDFPAYANLSGWSTKGKLACPWCHSSTCCLRCGGKECYLGDRRYLPSDHPWRDDVVGFCDDKGHDLAPKPLNGDDVLSQVKDLEGIQLSKEPSVRVSLSHEQRGDNWNKKSIFFELPYWRTLSLRHNLDVMHIEKNICDNVMNTIMDVKGKTKDTLKCRMDLKEKNLMPHLHPIEQGDNLVVPVGMYTLPPHKRRIVCEFLKALQVPDSFASNISKCVNMKESKILGLKSHDCHIILQRLLPLFTRGLLPKEVYEPLFELSSFFRVLCAKEIVLDELERVENQIPLTLCKLEKVFPPTFFDVMVHLTVHLASEALLGGPVQYRWMYPVERFLFTLKSFIRNRASPEASIAEGFIAQECSTLISRYLQGIDTKFNRPPRNFDGGVIQNLGGLSIFCHLGRPLGTGKAYDLTIQEWEQAHAYVLKNCQEVQPFINKYHEIQQKKGLEISMENWNSSFIKWFRKAVEYLHKEGKISDDMLSLGRGPTESVMCFSGYITNGYRFHIEERDKGLVTQNCGVVVVGDAGLSTGILDYYGVLTQVMTLQYLGAKRVTLFRCRWWDVHDVENGVKIDEYGFVSINSRRLLKTNEPFVLASQASQAFYVDDLADKGRHIAVKTQPRDFHQIISESKEDTNDMENEIEAFQLNEPEPFMLDCLPYALFGEGGKDYSKIGEGEPMIADKNLIKRRRKQKKSGSSKRRRT